jgi:hypothetical protein
VLGTAHETRAGQPVPSRRAGTSRDRHELRVARDVREVCRRRDGVARDVGVCRWGAVGGCCFWRFSCSRCSFCCCSRARRSAMGIAVVDAGDVPAVGLGFGEVEELGFEGEGEVAHAAFARDEPGVDLGECVAGLVQVVGHAPAVTVELAERRFADRGDAAGSEGRRRGRVERRGRRGSRGEEGESGGEAKSTKIAKKG